MTTVASPPGAVSAAAESAVPAADTSTTSTPGSASPASTTAADDVASIGAEVSTNNDAPTSPTPRDRRRGEEQVVSNRRDAEVSKTKAEPAAAGEWRVEDLPRGAQKLINELRKEAGDHRVAAKTAQEQAKETATRLDQFLEGFAKVMGLAEEPGSKEPPDPDKLTAELETVQQSHREATIRLAVYDAATELGGNPKALTDSVSFLNKVQKLNPAADDFADQVADAVRDAVASNPLFKAAGQAPAQPAPPSGGQFAGGPGRAPDLESMSVEDFRKALNKRRPA